MKAKRGEFGYINARKKRTITGVLLMILLGVLVFGIGLYLNNMSKQNIFTVAAVLFVLPGAKFLVGFIVVFPYHSASKEMYDKLTALLPTEGVHLYADLVITSPEKVMHLDFLVVGFGEVIGILGEGKQDIKYIRKYLSEGVSRWGDGYKVKIVDSEKTFLSEAASMSEREVDEEEEMRVNSYLKSLIV